MATATMQLRKLALRREDDGTPQGYPAPLFCLCPCGTKMPVKDRDGKPVSDVIECGGCGLKIDAQGWVIQS